MFNTFVQARKIYGIGHWRRVQASPHVFSMWPRVRAARAAPRRLPSRVTEPRQDSEGSSMVASDLAEQVRNVGTLGEGGE